MKRTILLLMLEIFLNGDNFQGEAYISCSARSLNGKVIIFWKLLFYVKRKLNFFNIVIDIPRV